MILRNSLYTPPSLLKEVQPPAETQRVLCGQPSPLGANKSIIYFLHAVLSILFLLSGQTSFAQITQLPLTKVIQLAQNQSIAARRAATLKTTRYWEWRTFKSNYKPRVELAGTLPGFTRSFAEVTQNDGTVDFRSVSNNNSRLDLSLSQSLALTGGTIFVGSSWQRFDDFIGKNTRYNGTPFVFGFSQPLFNFNALKWDKKVEPLRYQESQQIYLSDLEEIALNTVDYFFLQMIAQINLDMATNNLENTDTIYQITLERFDLGKASRNDVLQLKLETLKAQKALGTAEQDLATASQRLRSFIGNRQSGELTLVIPDQIPSLNVDLETALRETMQNRPDAISFHRRKLEAERDIAQAKGENGFTASLIGSFGLSSMGNTIGELYQNPQDKESIFLQFNFPILDWGRAKSQMETAKANQQLILYEIEQDQINLEQDLITQITLLSMYTQQVKLTKEADEVAETRYQIAQDRFLLGNLSITDLSIALQEKVQAKGDYVRSLWEFWRTYYSIRVLTLYDFEENKKIIY